MITATLRHYYLRYIFKKWEKRQHIVVYHDLSSTSRNKEITLSRKVSWCVDSNTVAVDSILTCSLWDATSNRSHHLFHVNVGQLTRQFFFCGVCPVITFIWCQFLFKLWFKHHGTLGKEKEGILNWVWHSLRVQSTQLSNCCSVSWDRAVRAIRVELQANVKLLNVWESIFLISISSFCIRGPLTSEHDTRNSWESCWTQQEKAFPSQLQSHSNTCWHYSAQQQPSHSSWWSGWQQKERKENSLPLSVVPHQTQLHNSEVGERISL